MRRKSVLDALQLDARAETAICGIAMRLLRGAGRDCSIDARLELDAIASRPEVVMVLVAAQQSIDTSRVACCTPRRWRHK